MSKRTRDDSFSPESETGGDLLEEPNKYQLIAESPQSPTRAVIKCFLPPHTHPYSFVTYDELDVHYKKAHANRCLECDKNFPTDHFLSLHITENHNSLTEARKARGDSTYACFVEDCDKVCYSSRRRRQHLIAKHGFPENYNFFITNDGVDRRRSMLVPKWALRPEHRSMNASNRSAAGAVNAPEAEQSEIGHPEEQARSDDDGDEDNAQSRDSKDTASSPNDSKELQRMPTSTNSADDGIDAIIKSMSSLRFIPPSVRFGRGKGRGFRR